VWGSFLLVCFFFFVLANRTAFLTGHTRHLWQPNTRVWWLWSWPSFWRTQQTTDRCSCTLRWRSLCRRLNCHHTLVRVVRRKVWRGKGRQDKTRQDRDISSRKGYCRRHASHPISPHSPVAPREISWVGQGWAYTPRGANSFNSW